MITQTDLMWIVRRIVALYDPAQIYLFGSYAKGTATPPSDLDFVVIKQTQVARFLRGRDVGAVLAEAPVPIDFLFVTPHELEQERKEPYSLLATVMPTATLLYDRESLTS
jgi:predicted nucleotidyltransferase